MRTSRSYAMIGNWPSNSPKHSPKLLTMKIPNSVVAVISDAFATQYTHAELDTLFQEHGAPGEPAVGNKVVKCSAWLKAVNRSDTFEPLTVLGAVLEAYMDYEIGEWDLRADRWKADRERIVRALAGHGLSYILGGRVTAAGSSTPARTLEAILRARDFGAVQEEFDRALATIESDPRAAATAACSLIESLCKLFIEDKELEMPSDQTIKPLWKVVSKGLGLDPGSLADDDLKKILSGMTSIVDGLGSFRTHVGRLMDRDANPTGLGRGTRVSS